MSERALGADFVVSALAARGDGVSTLLHMPLTATQYNVYRLALAPDGASVDLVVPQLLLRATENSTISEATHAYGAWSGWVRTFKATRLKRWALNESATEAAAADAAGANETNDTNSSRRECDGVVRSRRSFWSTRRAPWAAASTTATRCRTPPRC